MGILVEILVGAFLAGLAVGLIAWMASNVNCTELRELPEKPIPMEHEHGGGSEDDADR